ncbi:dehydrogenase/reductase SDR family member 4-like [Rhinatrema bivittatum]|uniref:dehydrogenase/reductase SDR family member 4-like n=1 Tax=Rhinatrema bivittatum TaxID=194408 RepID=UPI0011273C43|nr:dehydrogenase/reductase SDR family member 4-like [Rhinatrema bivittatum]XP_029435217.1 dehydrogenase/reductase SDR family member 4-like [Rhinatrema bivittatum]XP_029435218.1 dehydrogenase/reductase SDR family member 4-like [Rhinatrema bivittatum]XP_029435219.1 dehydrogenase/reductase SDR family member 4-like [Rhinatrema bivittatum]XP_029435220.1 dehydrogenase/reductase SDR family member 4-like [Rhinatrema bivittatum]
MLHSLCVLRRLSWSWPRMQSTTASGVLADKVALVTASTDGIGFAIARRLAQDGAKVVLSSRKQENVDKALAQLREENLMVSGTICHVGKEQDRERLILKAVEQYGGIDILVSNAAVNPFFGNILDSTEEVWDKILDVNVKATFLLVKKVVPHMEKRGGGSIVIVSSLAAYTPFPSLGPYSVSKTALLGLTKVLAPELASKNIRLNCLAPGLIKTKFSSALWQNQSMAKQFLSVLGAHRIGEAEDCAGVVSFLCSPDAAYISGETVVVAGGSQSRL